MPQIHRVIACTGEYDNYQQREVATFADKAVAERLARDAQAVADAIIARGTGVKDKGQNPHDLLMVIQNEVMTYYVSSSDVLEAPKADPAADGSLYSEVVDLFDFSKKQDGWNAIEVELNVGPRELSGEMEPLRGDAEEPARVHVKLRQMVYRGLTFTLRLEGHLVVQRWDEGFDTPYVRLEDLTAEEQHEAVSTGKAPDTMYDSVMPYLFWTCEALGEYFHERLHWASSEREASAQQLVRIVEGWLVGCRSRRTQRADLDEVLKRHGL